MDTLNDRIKMVRKHFSLSQTDFANKLGLSQRSVSWSEQPGNNVPDSTIKSICMAFSVDETWLRSGVGPMIMESSSFDLNQFVADHGGTPLDLEIIKAYLALPKEIRQGVVDFFRQFSSPPAPQPPTVDDLEAAYIKRSSTSASKATNSNPSNSTTGEKAAGD